MDSSETKNAELGSGTLSETLTMLRNKMDNEVKAQKTQTSPSKGGEQTKSEEEEKIIALTPAQRSMKYYERAKSLYTRGGGTSLELEIIIRDVAMAANFVDEDPKMFYFLAKVFKQQLDFNSSIYALRNVLRIDEKNRAARAMLGEVLFRRAQEVMGDAAIMDKEIQINRKTQDDVWRHYLSAKVAAEDKLAKQEAYTRQRNSALTIANKLRGTPAAGSIHVPPEVDFEDVQIPLKPILLKTPKRVQQYVSEQYRLACGLFGESLEYDRDNYKSIMAKAICLVYAEQFQLAIETVTRAIHLSHVRLKELNPSKQSRCATPNVQNETSEIMNDEPETTGFSMNQPPKSASLTTHQSIYYSDYAIYPTDEIADEILKLSRQVGEMLILRGKSYGAMGLTEKGNEDMRKASSIIPDHPECIKFGVRSLVRAEKIYNICMRKLKLREFDEALSLILMACSLSSTDVKLFITQARIYRAKEELEKAYQAIQKATQLYQGQSDFEMRIPEDIVKETNMIYNDIALQCASKGQYEKAILLLNKVISAEAQLARGVQDIDYRFYLNRGDCHRAKKHYGQALVDYNNAMSNLVSNKLGASSGLEGSRRQWVISTRLSITYYNVGCDYFNESAFADADVHLTKAIDNNPKVAEYYLTRGKARYYSGSYQNAYEDFKQTLIVDPNNAEAKRRLEQFSNLGIGVDAKNSETKAKVGLTLEEAKNSHGDVPPLVPTKEDVVEAMLHPQLAKKLPDITKSRSNNHTMDKTLLLPSKDARIVTQKMLMPSLMSVTMKNAQKKFQNILDTKHDTTKSVHWTMFKNAQKMASDRSRPPIDREKQRNMLVGDNVDPSDGNEFITNNDAELESVISRGGTKRYVPKSYTTAGLKRFSQKQTAKALKKGGLVAGVITHDKDPYLAGATEAQNTSAKAFTIDVSARPRPNKFLHKKSAADIGGKVETFETINHMKALAGDTTSWREQLRAENESDVDMDLLASLTGGGSSFFDNPSKGDGGFKTRKQKEEEAVAARAAARAERKRLNRKRKAELRAAHEAAALARATAALEEEESVDACDERRIGELDENGDMYLGKEFDAPEEGESEEAFQLRRQQAAEFLQQQQKASGIASMLGGNLSFAGISTSIHDDDENVSSLIALTEEQELQLAYEERIKAEHEEARRKKQEKLREKLAEQRSFNKLIGDEDDTSSGEDEG